MRITILLLTVTISSAGVVWAQPRVVSPEIAADGRVTFRLLAPQASEVVLTGEFLEGNQPLTKASDGIWSVTVGPLEPEIYHYNFTIDGVRTIDPGNAGVKTGSTPSTLASVLEVRGSSPAFYDGKPVPHGEIHTHWYHSKSLNALRRLTVYTPPGYDSDVRGRYPVLFLFHGANADETAWTRLGRVNLILDNLLAEGRTKPFIVVMPFGYGVTPGMPAAPGENTARVGKDVIEDVIPYIDAEYRVAPGREARAIAGLSMGGGQALAIGLNNLDVFSHVAGFSAAIGPVEDFATNYPTVVAAPRTVSDKLRLLWIGCGKEDRLYEASAAFAAFLAKNHVTHSFRSTPGAHTWTVWRRYLHELAPQLFR